jgi:hypothetical protein
MRREMGMGDRNGVEGFMYSIQALQNRICRRIGMHK